MNKKLAWIEATPMGCLPQACLISVLNGAIYCSGWGGGGGSREMIQHDPTTTKWMSTALALYYGSSLLAYYPSRT